ncbi:hypothetical protein ACWGQL_09285 [Streptomyces lydicus]
MTPRTAAQAGALRAAGGLVGERGAGVAVAAQQDVGGVDGHRGAEETDRQLFPRLAQDGRGARLVMAYLGTGVAFALWHLPTLLMGGQ